MYTISVTFLILIFISEILIVLIVFWNDILAFVMPEKWAKIEMINYDLSCKTWLQKTHKKLSFEYRGKEYKLYYKNNPEQKTPFRSGRLAHYKYFQNNEYPIKPNIENLNPNENNFDEVVKKNIDKFFIESDNLTWLKQNIITIIVIISLVIVVLVILFKQTPSAT